MAKKDAKKPAATTPPKPSAAAQEKDNEAQPPVYRADLGEALPPQPFPTATDNE